MFKVILAIWGSTAITIGIALYYTHDMRCLWFLLIPAFMRYRDKGEAESDDFEDELLEKNKFTADDKILMEFVGKKVTVYFKEGERAIYGLLEYVNEFSAPFDERRPGYFYINHTLIKSSEVKRIEI